MDKLQKPESMIFDLDGTLFRSESIFIEAYHLAFDRLREEGHYSGETPPEKVLLGSLGLLLEQIWANVLPEASIRVRERLNELVLKVQLELLAAGKGEIYAGVAETLTELKRRGIRLFVASNGLEHYVKGVISHMGLSPLFTALYSADEFKTRSKVDLVRLLMTHHDVASAWMVGDRSSDVEAGTANGLPVIGCHYAGFLAAGELDRANVKITAFPQLLTVLQSEA